MAEIMEVRVKLDDQASRQLRAIDNALRGLDNRMGGLGAASTNAGLGLGRLASGATVARAGIAAIGVAAVATTRAILESSRAYENTVNQLRLVTNGTEDYNNTIARLTNLALENRTSFDATVELYTKLRVATEDLGYSTETVENLTTKLSQALAVAGADAGTANGVIRQFGQAMASGVVRGDEFNSIVEGLGPALNIMARESGMTVGQLRELAGNGELTAEVFANMLLNSNALSDSFSNMRKTMDQVDEALGDSLTNLGAAIDNYFGLSETLKDVKTAATGLNNALAGVINEAAAPETLAEQYDRLTASLRALQDAQNPTVSGAFATDPEAALFASAMMESQSQAVADLKAEIAELQMVMFRQAEAQSRANYESALATQTAAAEAAKIEELNAIYGRYANTRTVAAERQRELAQAQEEQNASLTRLLQNNIQSLSVEEQSRVAYNEKVEAIRQLNEQLNTNSTLSSRQRQQIEATIAGLTLEKNQLHDVIKAGELYVSIIGAQESALAANAAQRTELLSLITQHEALLLSEQFNTEENRRSLELLNQALRDNAAARDELLGRPLNVETLSTRVNETLAEREANNQLLASYEAAGAGATQLAEAKRMLGIASDVSRSATQRELETYDEFYSNLEFNSRAHFRRVQNLQTAQNALNKLVAAGGENLAMHKRMLDEVNKGLQTISGQTANETFNVFETLESRLQGMVGTVSNTMTDVLFGLKDGFTSLQDIALSALRTIISTLIEAFIRSRILGQSLGGMGGIGGAGGLFGALGGLGASTLIPGLGALVGIGALIGGFFADGGSTARAGQKPIVVGERGPEIFLPGRAGTVVANEELNSMGNNAPLNVNFTINAIDTQSGVEFLIENKRVITGVIQEAYMRRGSSGPLG